MKSRDDSSLRSDRLRGCPRGIASTDGPGSPPRAAPVSYTHLDVYKRQEEERLNRVKYAAGLPARAIQFCLDRAGAKLTDVDHIAIPRDPWARLGTKLRFAVRMPRFALDRVRVMRRFAGVREDLAAAFDLAPDAIRAQFHRIEHHRAHLASAFFVSPFESAAVLSADGLGDFASFMCAAGEGPNMRALGEVAFPHSLGMYYTALTQYLGFWKFGDEYKVMGLAAYGQPEFLDEFRRIVRAHGTLSFRLGLEYFTHQTQGSEMTWRDASSTPVLGRIFSPHLEKRLGSTRQPDEPLTARHHNIAASMQAALEEVLGSCWNGPVSYTHLHDQPGQAGGPRVHPRGRAESLARS